MKIRKIIYVLFLIMIFNINVSAITIEDRNEMKEVRLQNIYEEKFKNTEIFTQEELNRKYTSRNIYDTDDNAIIIPDGYSSVQGATITDKYIVVAVIADGKDAMLIIINKNNYKVEKTITKSNYDFGHANDLAYNENKKEIYVVNGKKIHVLDSENFKVKSVKEFSNSYSGVDYDSKSNEYVISVASKVKRLDKNWNRIGEEVSLFNDDELVPQGIGVLGKNVYYASWVSSAKAKASNSILKYNQNVLHVYNYDDNESTWKQKIKMLLPRYDINGKVKNNSRKNECGELETVFFDGNKIIFMYQHFLGSGIPKRIKFYEQVLGYDVKLDSEVDTYVPDNSEIVLGLYDEKSNLLGEYKYNFDKKEFPKIKISKEGNYILKQIDKGDKRIKYDMTETKIKTIISEKSSRLFYANEKGKEILSPTVKDENGIISTKNDSIPINIELKNEANKYIISYMSNDEQLKETTEVIYGETYGDLIEPSTRDGYVFDGWYKDSKFEVQAPTKNDIVEITSNITLYAKWIPKYEVSYYLNQKKLNYVTEVIYGQKYGDLESIEMTGYTFEGWYNDNREEIKSDTIVTTSNNIRLYAKMKANEYTITYISNGELLDKAQVTYDEEYGELLIPTREGYTFEGWYSKSDLTGEKITSDTKVKIIEDTKLYAKWIPNKYIITYIIDKETGEKLEDTTKVTYEEPYGNLLSASAKEGYSWQGWCLDKSCNNLITSSSIVQTNGNHNLYARYVPNRYTITYISNGEQLEETKEVIYGDKYNHLEEPPAREGYLFAGWYLDEKFKEEAPAENDVVKITEDINLYAKWIVDQESQKITIKYMPNIPDDEADEPLTQITEVTYGKEYGSLLSLTDLDGYEVTGYTFKGWCLDKDCKTRINNTTIVDKNESHTLYGRWVANLYKFRIDAAGGKSFGGLLNTNLAYKSQHKIAEPTRAGYEFSGWIIEGNESIIDENNMLTMGNSDTTLTATWEPKVYKITYITKNGEEENIEGISNVTYDNVYGELLTQIRKGYTFEGWYLDEEFKEEAPSETDIVKITEDIKLYANWKQIIYSLTIDPVEGEYNGDLELNLGYNETVKLKNPTKTGYAFKGWSVVGEESSENDNVFTMGTANTTLTANWEPKQYEITYISNNQQLEKTTKVTYDDEYGNLIEPPTREGYVFAGWYLDEEFKEESPKETDKVKITKNITLYAKWIEEGEYNEITIKYIPNMPNKEENVDELPLQQTKKVICAQPYGSLLSLTDLDGYEVTGYTFKGWCLDKDCKTRINNTTIVDKNESHTLYGRWVANLYKFRIDAAGGKSFGGLLNTNLAYKSQHKIAEPTRAGYEFSGWIIEGNESIIDENNMLTMGNSDTTLTATWEPKVYKITYITKNDEEEKIEGTAQVTYDEEYGDLLEPTRLGYTFEGWYSKSDLTGEKITSDTKVTILEDTNLYAKWEKEFYKLTINSKGGLYDGNVEETSEYGGVIEIKEPTRKGYKFTGWTIEGKGSSLNNNILTMGVEDTTLTATWQPNRYEITYVMNVETGETSEETKEVIYDNVYGELLVPKRNGYAFKGWYLDEEGKNQIKATTLVEKAESHTLYAKWEPEFYKLSIDPKGGEYSGDLEVTLGYKETTNLKNPTRLGYTFKGWFVIGAVSSVKDNVFTMGIQNTMLTAIWEPNKYKITYVSNGQQLEETKDVTYDNVYGELLEPTRLGYTFKGWCLDEECKIKVETTTIVEKTESHTLYADWEQDKYSLIIDPAGGEYSGDLEVTLSYQQTIELKNPTKEGYKFIEWEVLGEGSSIEDNIFIMGTEEVVLIAQWELIVPDIESTSNYKLKEDLIKNISLGTDLNDFNLGLDSIYNVKIYNKDLVEKTKGNIATGDKIRIYLDDLLVIEYIAVVKGDVTGTGTSTVSDVAKLYQYLKKKITMEECYVEAGNVVDIDNEIKINDVAKLYQFIKGKINSLED